MAIIGVLAILVILLLAPKSGTHQTASFMFGSAGWHAFAGLSGFSLPFYIFLIGLLNAQYTFTGYDASAHVTEETVQANMPAAKGIIRSIWVSLIAGFLLLFGVSIAIPPLPVDFEGPSSRATPTSPSPRPVGGHLQVHRRQAVAELLILIVIGAQFYCGMSSVTANSRMIYAFSRDGAVPFSNYWHHVNKRSRVPVRTAWFGAVGAFILALPYMINSLRLRRRDLDRGHRPLHRLPHAGVPAAHQRQGVRARSLGAEQDVERDDRLDRDRLGRLHLHRVHAAVRTSPTTPSRPSTTRRSPWSR